MESSTSDHEENCPMDSPAAEAAADMDVSRFVGGIWIWVGGEDDRCGNIRSIKNIVCY